MSGFLASVVSLEKFCHTSRRLRRTDRESLPIRDNTAAGSNVVERWNVRFSLRTPSGISARAPVRSQMAVNVTTAESRVAPWLFPLTRSWPANSTGNDFLPAVEEDRGPPKRRGRTCDRR